MFSSATSAGIKPSASSKRRPLHSVAGLAGARHCQVAPLSWLMLQQPIKKLAQCKPRHDRRRARKSVLSLALGASSGLGSDGAQIARSPHTFGQSPHRRSHNDQPSAIPYLRGYAPILTAQCRASADSLMPLVYRRARRRQWNEQLGSSGSSAGGSSSGGAGAPPSIPQRPSGNGFSMDAWGDCN